MRFSPHWIEIYPVESFIYPLDIGSCRRQVLLPVIEKPATPTVPSVPAAVPSVRSVPAAITSVLSVPDFIK